jgi:hypothetical protein
VNTTGIDGQHSCGPTERVGNAGLWKPGTRSIESGRGNNVAGNIHWTNLKYLLRHKWEVAKAGWKYGVPLHQLIFHDWSKFLPMEWFGYARHFYGVKTDKTKMAFNYAWNHHQKANKHHWNYWCMVKDGGVLEALEMPERFAREMVADWTGAGIAIKGYDDTKNWYKENRNKIMLHPRTRNLVEFLLDYKHEGWDITKIDPSTVIV